MRSRLINLAVLFVSICVALGIVEAYLRVMGYYLPPNNPLTTAQPELYQSDPNVGYRLRSNLNTSYRYPATSKELIPVVSNSDGFRNSREFDERDGRPRILVTGDSFVFGQGVRAEDRLTEQLESMEPRWRVDNMGMTGWGIDLMIRAIEQFGKKAHPDVVVLSVYTDDFRRMVPYYAGVGFAYPKFEAEGKVLVTRPFPYPNAIERLRLVQFVYQTTWYASGESCGMGTIIWCRNRNRYDLNEALLSRFLNDGEAIGFKPVVVFFPGKGDNQEDQERRAFLSQWTQDHHVPYRDLTDVVQKAGIDNVYIADNWHWNAAGHRVAAQQLKDLLQEVLNPASQSSQADIR